MPKPVSLVEELTARAHEEELYDVTSVQPFDPEDNAQRVRDFTSSMLPAAYDDLPENVQQAYDAAMDSDDEAKLNDYLKTLMDGGYLTKLNGKPFVKEGTAATDKDVKTLIGEMKNGNVLLFEKPGDLEHAHHVTMFRDRSAGYDEGVGREADDVELDTLCVSHDPLTREQFGTVLQKGFANKLVTKDERDAMLDKVSAAIKEEQPAITEAVPEVKEPEPDFNKLRNLTLDDKVLYAIRMDEGFTASPVKFKAGKSTQKTLAELSDYNVHHVMYFDREKQSATILTLGEDGKVTAMTEGVKNEKQFARAMATPEQKKMLDASTEPTIGDRIGNFFHGIAAFFASLVGVKMEPSDLEKKEEAQKFASLAGEVWKGYSERQKQNADTRTLRTEEKTRENYRQLRSEAAEMTKEEPAAKAEQPKAEQPDIEQYVDGKNPVQHLVDPVIRNLREAANGKETLTDADMLLKRAFCLRAVELGAKDGSSLLEQSLPFMDAAVKNGNLFGDVKLTEQDKKTILEWEKAPVKKNLLGVLAKNHGLDSGHLMKAVLEGMNKPAPAKNTEKTETKPAALGSKEITQNEPKK